MPSQSAQPMMSPTVSQNQFPTSSHMRPFGHYPNGPGMSNDGMSPMAPQMARQQSVPMNNACMGPPVMNSSGMVNQPHVLQRQQSAPQMKSPISGPSSMQPNGNPQMNQALVFLFISF